MSIIVDKISYTYEIGTGFERQALKEVSCVIEKGEFIGLIGHTGSGKSTFIQHLNGLVKATSGAIYYDGEDIYDKDFDMRKLRSKVGLVFQYPEHQLFETDIFKDVCFGPKNLGLDRAETELRAFEALRLVGLDESLYYQSPFDLSGGQKRRVAIAGVLAMKPEVLILDEPTAGLDPKQRIAIRNYISKISFNKIVLIATHVVSDIEFIARNIIMLKKGVIVDNAPPHELTKKIEGKVWNVPCAESDVQALQDIFRVTNIARDEETGAVLLRVLADEQPTDISKVVAPTLEDYYLYVFGETSLAS